MITKRDVIADAADKCMKELYSLAQPAITWEDFIKENKEFIKKEKEYYKLPEENRISYREFMGPRPYEFYYLPQEVFKEVVDSYIYAYEIDEHKNLLDTIDLLKKYCNDPIVEKWIEGDEENPGHKGYEHPDNLEKELIKYIHDNMSQDGCQDEENESIDLQNLFFKFLDMAGKFYNSHWWLNSFNATVYLGASPNSNKEAVIENWKKYRNQDIEIDESKYNEEDYD